MRCLKWGFAIAIGAFVLAGCAAAPMTGHNLTPMPTVEAVRPAMRDTHIQDFSESVRPIDGEIAAKYQLARHFQRLGYHRIAAETLKEVVRLAPDHAEGYNALGISQDFLKTYADAQRSYLTAILLDRKMDAAYNNLGYSYLLSGKHAEAIDMFTQAIALNSAEDKYRKNLGLAYVKAGDTRAAVAELRKIRETGKAAELCARLGLAAPENPAGADVRPDAVPSTPLLVEQASAADSPHANGEAGEQVKVLPDAPEMRRVSVTPVATADDAGGAVTEGPRTAEGLSSSATVEICNGNGVRGMARRIALHLTAKGIAIRRLTNADHYAHAHTVIFYRDGFQDAAARIHPLLPGLTGGTVRLESAELAHDPIRVLLGRDMVQPQLPRDLDAKQPVARPRVDVSNGNGASGMAKRLAGYLRQKGFAIGRLENADHFGYSRTIVFYSRGQIEPARKLAAALPEGCPSKLVELANSNGRVQVVLGADMAF